MAWEDNREIELLSIMANLVPLQKAGIIKTLDRNPVGKIVEEEMDSVLLFEGPDIVETQAGSDSLGPQQRVLSLAFELWVYNDSNDISAAGAQLRNLYNEVRKASMRKRALEEKSLTRVFTGPTPGVIGVGLITELKYVNVGN